jgi:hypothetical protein
LTGAVPSTTGAAARRSHSPPALSWRAVGLSAALAFGVAAVSLPAVAARTGGWLARGDGLAYFLYARALVVEGGADPSAGYRLLDARLPADPLGPMAALRESARRQPGGGRIVLPWPIGAGLLMAPFYAAGWGAEKAAARHAGRAPDSFGFLPQLFYGFGAVAYGLLAFWASFLTAARVADAGAAALAVLALMLGGPAAFYVFLHPTIAHAASLGLAALLVLTWWRLWETGEAGAGDGAGVLAAPPPARGPVPATRVPLASLALLAALLGLLVLVRYQNVVFALLPAALLARLAVRRGRRAARTVAVGAALTGLACAAPFGMALAAQEPAAVTAAAAGHAAEPPAAAATATPAATATAATAVAKGAGQAAAGDGGLVVGQNRFDLRSPHFFAVLVSCQHGAFYWTPVLGLGAAALAWAAVHHGWGRVLAAVLLANVYLVGCLAGGTNWSGDNAYGMRYLVESVPLLAPPLAALVAPRPSARWAWTLALALLVAANGLLMLAFARHTIAHGGCVTYRQMAAGIAEALTRVPREMRRP